AGAPAAAFAGRVPRPARPAPEGAAAWPWRSLGAAGTWAGPGRVRQHARARQRAGGQAGAQGPASGGGDGGRARGPARRPAVRTPAPGSPAEWRWLAAGPGRLAARAAGTDAEAAVARRLAMTGAAGIIAALPWGGSSAGRARRSQ